MFDVSGRLAALANIYIVDEVFFITLHMVEALLPPLGHI